MDDFRNILLIQLGDIGDVVLSLPCIKTLRENFPNSNVIVAVREKARDLMEDCTWIQGLISVNNEKRPFLDRILYQKDFFSMVRRFRFDLAIDLRTGTRGALLAFFSGARKRIGFYAEDGKLWRNRLFTDLIVPKTDPGQYLGAYYLSLLASYGLSTTKANPVLEVSHEKQQQATDLLRENGVPKGRPLVAVHPFSLWQYKEWGASKYAELINRLLSEYDASVVIIGAPGERKRAEEITDKCKKRPVNLAGKSTLSLLAAILKGCSFFIGGDSAGMHIAGAVGLPTVVIFGPSDPLSWAPRGRKHKIVAKKQPCVPCRDKGCEGTEVCPCLDDLMVDEVFREIINHSHWKAAFTERSRGEAINGKQEPLVLAQ